MSCVPKETTTSGRASPTAEFHKSNESTETLIDPEGQPTTLIDALDPLHTEHTVSDALTVASVIHNTYPEGYRRTALSISAPGVCKTKPLSLRPSPYTTTGKKSDFEGLPSWKARSAANGGELVYKNNFSPKDLSISRRRPYYSPRPHSESDTSNWKNIAGDRLVVLNCNTDPNHKPNIGSWVDTGKGKQVCPTKWQTQGSDRPQFHGSLFGLNFSLNLRDPNGERAEFYKNNLVVLPSKTSSVRIGRVVGHYLVLDGQASTGYDGADDDRKDTEGGTSAVDGDATSQMEIPLVPLGVTTTSSAENEATHDDEEQDRPTTSLSFMFDIEQVADGGCYIDANGCNIDENGDPFIYTFSSAEDPFCYKSRTYRHLKYHEFAERVVEDCIDYLGSDRFFEIYGIEPESRACFLFTAMLIFRNSPQDREQGYTFTEEQRCWGKLLWLWRERLLYWRDIDGTCTEELLSEDLGETLALRLGFAGLQKDGSPLRTPRTLTEGENERASKVMCAHIVMSRFRDAMTQGAPLTRTNEAAQWGITPTFDISGDTKKTFIAALRADLARQKLDINDIELWSRYLISSEQEEIFRIRQLFCPQPKDWTDQFKQYIEHNEDARKAWIKSNFEWNKENINFFLVGWANQTWISTWLNERVCRVIERKQIQSLETEQSFGEPRLSPNSIEPIQQEPAREDYPHPPSYSLRQFRYFDPVQEMDCYGPVITLCKKDTRQKKFNKEVENSGVLYTYFVDNKDFIRWKCAHRGERTDRCCNNCDCKQCPCSIGESLYLTAGQALSGGCPWEFPRNTVFIENTKLYFWEPEFNRDCIDAGPHRRLPDGPLYDTQDSFETIDDLRTLELDELCTRQQNFDESKRLAEAGRALVESQYTDTGSVVSPVSDHESETEQVQEYRKSFAAPVERLVPDVGELLERSRKQKHDPSFTVQDPLLLGAMRQSDLVTWIQTQGVEHTEAGPVEHDAVGEPINETVHEQLFPRADVPNGDVEEAVESIESTHNKNDLDDISPITSDFGGVDEEANDLFVPSPVLSEIEDDMLSVVAPLDSSNVNKDSESDESPLPTSSEPSPLLTGETTGVTADDSLIEQVAELTQLSEQLVEPEEDDVDVDELKQLPNNPIESEEDIVDHAYETSKAPWDQFVDEVCSSQHVSDERSEDSDGVLVRWLNETLRSDERKSDEILRGDSSAPTNVSESSIVSNRKTVISDSSPKEAAIKPLADKINPDFARTSGCTIQKTEQVTAAPRANGGLGRKMKKWFKNVVNPFKRPKRDPSVFELKRSYRTADAEALGSQTRGPARFDGGNESDCDDEIHAAVKKNEEEYQARFSNFMARFPESKLLSEMAQPLTDVDSYPQVSDGATEFTTATKAEPCYHADEDDPDRSDYIPSPITPIRGQHELPSFSTQRKSSRHSYDGCCDEDTKKKAAVKKGKSMVLTEEEINGFDVFLRSTREGIRVVYLTYDGNIRVPLVDWVPPWDKERYDEVRKKVGERGSSLTLECRQVDPQELRARLSYHYDLIDEKMNKLKIMGRLEEYLAQFADEIEQCRRNAECTVSVQMSQSCDGAGDGGVSL